MVIIHSHEVTKMQIKKSTKTEKTLVVTVMLSLLLGSIIGYTIAQTSNTFYMDTGIYPLGDYTIYEEGALYHAKNIYGVNVYEDYTNLTTIIQNCIDDLTNGFIVVFNLQIPLEVTFKNGVLVREIYHGTITDYPFPRNMGDFTVIPLFYMGVFAFENDYYVMKYNKDLWINPAETNFGCETCRGCAVESDSERYYGIYEWKYYHTGNETSKIFATGLAWTGMCTVQGAYFQQNADGTLITDTALDTNIEQQSVSNTEWNPNVESTLKIEWSATYVKFYINGILINTHVTRVPNEPMQFLFEIDHNAHAGNFVYDSYQYMTDFRSYIDG